MSAEEILIWDVDDTPSAGDGISVMWRGYDTGGRDDVVSIPQIVEDNAERLRARYLTWIYELGESRVRGRRIVDHLEIRPNFSYWWMTRLAEKCNYSKSTQIDDAIRLIAFDEWANSRSIGRIELVSSNHSLAECVRIWCASSGVVFVWRQPVKSPVYDSWVRRIYQAAPHVLQAWVWLIHYLINRWPLRGVGLEDWQQSEGRITFFSYLFNLNIKAHSEGRHESHYWADLPAVLLNETCRINWLHLYVKDAHLSTSKQAADAIRVFNSTGSREQIHVSLDTFLGVRVIFWTLRDWLKMLFVSIGLKRQLRFELNPSLDLRPLFDDDWRKSLLGEVAMSNLLNLNLFEAALSCLPKQKCGLYLQENQPWEFALIGAWNTAGHGRLIGTPHSTVRFWHLRYYFDPRSYRRDRNNDLPMPSQVAVNGSAVLHAYQRSGYPIEELVEVEALRYLHLCRSSEYGGSKRAHPVVAIRVLVLCDYLASNTRQQMKLLEQAITCMQATMLITVKPHPNCPISPNDYPGISMTVTMEPIAKLLANCDVAYSSAVTSAAVDAYCAGVPTVSVLDPNTLNLSPLRDCKGVLFVSTGKELASALTILGEATHEPQGSQRFFTLDPQLPRWRKLLLDSVGLHCK